MTETITINRAIARGLEESEAAYWGKYYTPQAPLPNLSTKIAGAHVMAIPQLDMLAMNRVIGLGINEPVTADDIEEIIRFYRQAGCRRFFIQLSPYVVQRDLPRLMVLKGLRPYNYWVKLLGTTDSMLPLYAGDITIRKATVADASTYGHIIFSCFDWQEPRLTDWLSSTIGQPGYQHYLAEHRGQPIAAAALHCGQTYASMAFAGTLPAWRGRGAQSLLLQARMTDAREAGCAYIVGETAAPTADKPVASYRNMVRAGLQPIYRRANWIMEF